MTETKYKILQPTHCNLGGGRVHLVSNGVIYGKEYGSGKVYLCEQCESYVGTHKNSPLDAMGLLSNKQMRLLKQECHRIFDEQWSTRSERTNLYRWLSVQMGISTEMCHFGWFDEDELKKALNILRKEFVETR